MVDVAQLVRASDCGSEGRGFEPLLPPLSRKRLEVSKRFFCVKPSVSKLTRLPQKNDCLRQVFCLRSRGRLGQGCRNNGVGFFSGISTSASHFEPLLPPLSRKRLEVSKRFFCVKPSVSKLTRLPQKNDCLRQVFCPRSRGQLGQGNIRVQKRERFSSFPFRTPPQGLDCATCVGSRVLESLHPPILPEREAHSGFSPEGIKQKIRWKTIGPFVVPPQGVAYTRTEWRRTNNLRTWFAIGFDFLSKSCLTSQTYLIYPIFYNNSVPKTLWTSAKVLHLTTVASSLISFSLC